MRRPGKRLDIVREESRTKKGRKKLRWRMRQRGFCTPSFARDLVAAVAEDVTTDPAGSLPLARFCVQIARRSGDQCAHTRSAAILSGARLLVGKLELSERTLDFAFHLANQCPSCQPILHRTLAFLRLYQHRRGLASRAADRAVELALPLDDNVEKGRSLHCRSVIRDYRGHLRKAIADTEAALRVLPHDDALFSAVIHSYAVTLARRGDPASVQRAAELIPEIEERFRGLKGHSVERAKLAWLRGEIARAQADARQAVQHLERARAAFVRRRMPLEIAAVCADIAAIQVTRPWPMEAVRRVMATLSATAEERGIVFPAALRPPLERVARATRAGLNELRAALRELRDATVELGCPPPIVA